MKIKLPSILLLAVTVLGVSSCAQIPGTQPMQPAASVEQIEREGAGVSPSGESVEQALNARNAVDYANDRGGSGWGGGWGGGRGLGWGGPVPRF